MNQNHNSFNYENNLSGYSLAFDENFNLIQHQGDSLISDPDLLSFVQEYGLIDSETEQTDTSQGFDSSFYGSNDFSNPSLPEEGSDYNEAIIVHPQIIRRDVRLEYQYLYVNTCNSCDRMVCLEFLTKFCTPKCFLQVDNLRLGFPLHRDKITLHVVGLEHILSTYNILLIKFPDLCYRLKNHRQRVANIAAISMITSQLQLEGMDPIKTLKFNEGPIEIPKQQNWLVTNSNLLDFVQYAMDFTTLYFSGKNSLYIDENGFICGIVMS